MAGVLKEHSKRTPDLDLEIRKGLVVFKLRLEAGRDEKEGRLIG